MQFPSGEGLPEKMAQPKKLGEHIHNTENMPESRTSYLSGLFLISTGTKAVFFSTTD